MGDLVLVVDPFDDLRYGCKQQVILPQDHEAVPRQIRLVEDIQLYRYAPAGQCANHLLNAILVDSDLG